MLACLNKNNTVIYYNTLWKGSNKICDEGAINIVEALKKNNNLESIELCKLSDFFILSFSIF